jgi:hypothetical protein
MEEMRNEGLHDLRFSANIIRLMKSRTGRVAHLVLLRERRGADRVFMGKSEGKRRLGRPKRRWENKIKIYLREIEWETIIDGSA